MMTEMEVELRIQHATQVVGKWPAWKKTILAHSSQPTNSTAREPVNNRVFGGPEQLSPKMQDLL